MGDKEKDGLLVQSVGPEERAADQACWTNFVHGMMVTLMVCFVVLYLVWETPGAGEAIRTHSSQYFIYCAIGGIFAGLPHTILTPWDLIKCRVQTGEYKNATDGFKMLVFQECRNEPSKLGKLQICFRGVAPTFIGYSIQGMLKFALYELNKFLLAHHVFGVGFSVAHPIVVHMLASAGAEVIADVGLCPWESMKVKMQTTRQYPPKLGVVAPRMYAAEKMSAFYKGLTPLWCRQVPYTIMKFVAFEQIIMFLYSIVPKESLPSTGQLACSLLAGFGAGVSCALVSHPADTVVSVLNKRTGGGAATSSSSSSSDRPSSSSANSSPTPKSPTSINIPVDHTSNSSSSSSSSQLREVITELGCAGLWTGLVPRLMFIGTLTAMQWLIYDSFKVALGLQTAGGKK